MATADELQILITTKDELSAKIRDSQKAVQRMTGELTELGKHLDTVEGRKAFDRQAEAIAATNGEIRRLRSEAAKTGRAIRNFGADGKKSIDQATQSTNRLATAMDRVKSKMRAVNSAAQSTSLTKWAKGGAIGLGAAAGAAALIGIKTAASMEQSQVAFESLLGSKGKAKQLLDDLAKMAAETPFEFPQLVTASQQLLAFGFGAKDITPMLTSIGDAAAATGSGADGVDRITRAIGQMQAKGKISNEELMQLGELGLPVYDIMAKKLGMAKADVMNFLAMPAKTIKNKDGSVTQEKGGATQAYQMLGGVSGLMDGLSQKYDGMMGKQSKTLAGLWSTLKDTFGMGVANMLQPYMDGIKGAATATINGLGGAFKRIGEIIEKVRPTVTRVFNFIRDNKTAFIAGAAAVALLTGAVLLLNAAMALNPVTLIIIAIGVVVGAIVAAYRRFSWFRSGVQTAWAWIKRVTAAFAKWFMAVAWPKIKAVLGYVVGYYKTLWSVAKVVWKGILAAVKVYVAWFKAVAWPAIKWVAQRIMDYWRLVASVAKAVWPKVRDAVNAVRTWLTNTAVPAFKTAVETVKTAFNTAKTAAETAWNGVKAAVTGPLDTIKTAVQGLKDLLSHLFDGVASAAKTAADAVSSAWNGIKDVAGALNPFGRWMGGPVPAGWNGWVGELGPEVFVPRNGTPRIIGRDGPEVMSFSQPGMVIPNHLVPMVLESRREPAMAGAGGPSVHIGTINANQGVDVEARVLHAMLRADRIARERR